MVTHSKKEVFMTLLALYCHDSAISTPLVRQDRLKFNLHADFRNRLALRALYGAADNSLYNYRVLRVIRKTIHKNVYQKKNIARVWKFETVNSVGAV